MAQQWTGGHTTPVLCIGAAAGAGGFLASGAEGGEVTVWTQEGTPLSQMRLTSRDDVTCTVFSGAAPGLLYVSHGETVTILDPRSLQKPVEELKDVGEDEINSLSLSETGASLALADDSGAVRVVDLQTGKVSRTLRKHTNICSSVAFRPQRPQSLVSAGLDMQASGMAHLQTAVEEGLNLPSPPASGQSKVRHTVPLHSRQTLPQEKCSVQLMLWNLQKARPVWTYSLQEALEEEEKSQQSAGQLFNPPLAHCVSVASCGNVLACAAEDGRVHLARVGAGSRLEQQGAIKTHSQGASQAHFLNFMPHAYWLATGGNDGVVALWDISEEPVVAGEIKVKAQRRKPKNRKSKPQGDEGKRSEEELSEEARSIDPSQTKMALKLKFNHEEKVNWVCPALLKGHASLLVADQSTSLSVYALSGL